MSSQFSLRSLDDLRTAHWPDGRSLATPQPLRASEPAARSLARSVARPPAQAQAPWPMQHPSHPPQPPHPPHPPQPCCEHVCCCGRPRPVGARGPRGPPGLEGAQGPEGYRGPQGPCGERGKRGKRGQQGDKGPCGERGAQGAPGRAELSLEQLHALLLALMARWCDPADPLCLLRHQAPLVDRKGRLVVCDRSQPLTFCTCASGRCALHACTCRVDPARCRAHSTLAQE